MQALCKVDSLRVSYPLLNFPLGVGAARFVLFTGGIRITALVAMASALRRRGADYTLVLVGRSRSVLPYLDELADEVSRAARAANTELYVCGPIMLMDACDDSGPGRSCRCPT